MNLPNKITIGRFLLVPCFVPVIFGLGNRPFALGIFCRAVLTDALDGYFVRTKGLRTTLGSFLDPLADHFLIIAALISVTIKDWGSSSASFPVDGGRLLLLYVW